MMFFDKISKFYVNIKNFDKACVTMDDQLNMIES